MNGARKPVKTKTVAIKFTPEQHDMIAERAERCKLSVATWMRHVLTQAASRPAQNGYLRIHEPNGTMT